MALTQPRRRLDVKHTTAPLSDLLLLAQRLPKGLDRGAAILLAILLGKPPKVKEPQSVTTSVTVVSAPGLLRSIQMRSSRNLCS